MDQETINQQEWKNPARWYPRQVRVIYISRRDTRLMVPKAKPGFGWTINFGHPYALAAVIAIILMGLALGFALETVI